MNEEGRIENLRKFYSKERRLPSYREMMGIFGYASKNSVKVFVDKLVERKILGKRDGKLSALDLEQRVRRLGTVKAGFPSPAEEELADTVDFNTWIGNKEASFLLTVSGDSMKDEGILEGDTVLVERTNNPKVGQIVIAEVDGGWTMKFLRQKKGKWYLEPANKAYKDIYPESEMRVVAVVKTVVRKYE